MKVEGSKLCVGGGVGGVEAAPIGGTYAAGAEQRRERERESRLVNEWRDSASVRTCFPRREELAQRSTRYSIYIASDRQNESSLRVYHNIRYSGFEFPAR